jgi:ribonuclease P protein component
MGHLPRHLRISTRREIAWLLSGERVRGSDLDLHWRPASASEPRATCITPKFGHTSVQRNKLRRRLSDLARRVLLSRPEAADYLVRARPTAYERGYDALEAELRSLAGRIEPRGAS